MNATNQTIEIPGLGNFTIDDVTTLLIKTQEDIKQFQSSYLYRQLAYNAIIPEHHNDKALAGMMDKVNYTLRFEEDAISGIVMRRLCAFFDRRPDNFTDR